MLQVGGRMPCQEISSTSEMEELDLENVKSEEEAGETRSMNRWLWRFLFIKQHRKAARAGLCMIVEATARSIIPPCHRPGVISSHGRGRWHSPPDVEAIN